MQARTLLTVLLFALLPLLTAVAEPTEITVRVISKDAKFIGSAMGGVEIVIRDTDTHELLAQGIIQGSTGDTQRIMENDWQRGVPLSTEDSAYFTATLEIDQPRKISVTAYGPLAQRQSANTVSVTQWVVPGKHLTGGDGLLLQMPGMVVEVLAPPAHLKLSGIPQTVEIKANVTMMCGCPIMPGGIWDVDSFQIKALLKHNGKAVGELPLQYAGTPSQFAANWNVEAPGLYKATVYAYDPTNGNTGLDQVTFIVEK